LADSFLCARPPVPKNSLDFESIFSGLVGAFPAVTVFNIERHARSVDHKTEESAKQRRRIAAVAARRALIVKGGREGRGKMKIPSLLVARYLTSLSLTFS